MSSVDPASTERRLAAILAADVVGYSRLMGADEIGTLRALKAMRAEILEPMFARHRGRVVKTTGDGFLVEFASIVDAVSCAVAIQRELEDFATHAASRETLMLRIGVNIGDIIIDGPDIFGDGVNLAARLESLCEPGGVAISRAAHEQIRDKLGFPFVDLGEQMVKNIARPVQVFGLSRVALAGGLPATRQGSMAVASAPPRPIARSAGLSGANEGSVGPTPREGEQPLPRKRRSWRARIILLVIAVYVLSHNSRVRYAYEQFMSWVSAQPAGPSDHKAADGAAAPVKPLPSKATSPTPANLSPPAPTAAPPSSAATDAGQPKPAQLAPLPPPIIVPPTATDPKGAEQGGAPLELHPQN